MYNCPTFFLFWKCLADISYWTNLYLTVADNELHFFTISNLNYTVFVSLAHYIYTYVPLLIPVLWFDAFEYPKRYGQEIEAYGDGGAGQKEGEEDRS